MSKYLYGASVQGIQDFIFQTNKLREIGGASEIVEQICTKKFVIEIGSGLIADNIIVNAAGNIKYIFEDKQSCEAFVLKFPQKISRFAPGITISQTVVEVKDNDKLSDAIDKLEKNLKTQRNKPENPIEVGFMGLERARRTGGVGVEKPEDEVLDSSIQAKIKAFEKARNKDLLKEKNEQNLYHKFFGEELDFDKIPFDLNQITKGKSNSWIAVIHADGNGLGSLLQKLGEKLKEKTIEEAKSVFAEFSVKLDLATQTAAKNAFNSLNSSETKYPLRPIILGGDDITLIIRADLAYDFTVEFLKQFETQTKEQLSSLNGIHADFEKGLTACAGIAYIKDSYPIHYGLHLAEQLTKKAKMASKKIDRSLPPSSLSFYKVQSSFIEDMEDIVNKTLTAGNISFDTGPYFIHPQSQYYSIKDLDEKLKILTEQEQSEEKVKGVSKLRQWISELYKNEGTAKFMMERMKVVNEGFYNKLELDHAMKDNKSIIFDLLQLHSFRRNHGN
ncbi:MAG: Cas10/Cmr2 second palm domain-containing protein [Spirosomataceae bacterium]